MRKGIIVTINAADCSRLEAVVAQHLSPHRTPFRLHRLMI
jgi:hypothetical protein